MTDGIYTHRGQIPLDSKNNRPAPLRKVLFVWGVVVLGVTLLGMTLSGLCKRHHGNAGRKG